MSELYSQRHGRPERQLSTEDFAALIWRDIVGLRERGYFGHTIGHWTIGGWPDEPEIHDPEAFFLRELRQGDLAQKLKQGDADDYPPTAWTEDETAIWDTLELLHSEIVFKAHQEGDRHSGTTTFDQEEGRMDLRETLNPDLALFNPPMELTVGGHIVEKAPDDLAPLLDDPVPFDIPAPLRDPLRAGIEQYRRRGASDQDKRSALKHLADVLEPLKEKIDESILPADEKALFHIANKFYIRHNDRAQQRNFDGDVWLDWVFYVYVATARALLAVVDRQEMSELVFGDEPDDNGALPI